MVAYDSKIIYEFAERLYREAAAAVVTLTAFGAITGFVIGAGAAAASSRANDEAMMAGAFVGIFAAVGGFLAGRGRAFRLRLQAQTALCQVRIEENSRSDHSFTRGPVGHASRPAV